MTNTTIVKALYDPKFEIELVQDEDGRYRVLYQIGSRKEHSEWITDYGTASYIFDIKLRELEGQ